MRFFIAVLGLTLSFAASTGLSAQQNYLANNTILIVRHAEKSPESGTGLTPQGENRAQLYTTYFRPFHDGGLNLTIDSLYAGADSKKSFRPRLTLEPLSKATGIPLHHEIGTTDPQALVNDLKTHPHGPHPLIAWRHSEIPNLIAAFGGSPSLLPESRWPDETYDWVVVLTTGPSAEVTSARLIREDLKVPLKR
ncbi:hypothetical protein [Terriglobus saanensis]|uniref:Phosphoglycerate mutase n=1 Tax=Terriglobus saanensis (strain ATCC BAA-1853 / DSM 23119 / SP1PR4) TaxID=401053 RepID=E8V1T1_TERSS|nr:hypothetical protein [Terriglobus saanensis]ADV82362.1 hypothetical protein AciPR4_1540 [Terriglobus saanensis SP1PR4]